MKYSLTKVLTAIFLLFLQSTLGQEVKVNRGRVTFQGNKNSSEIPFEGKSYALLIGNSDYEDNDWDDLPGVEEDLIEVEKVLQLHGYIVIKIENVISDEFRFVVKDFIYKYGQDENSRVLLYYAGHGHTLKDFGGYIVPVDAPKPPTRITDNFDISLQNEFRRRALRFKVFENFADDIISKHQLFVFDACFAGSVLTRGEQSISHEITVALQNPAKQIITSGTRNQSVPDISSFRKFFVKALASNAADRDQDSFVTYNELFGYLRREVTNEVSHLYNKTQTPQKGSFLNGSEETGEYVFKLPDDLEGNRIGKYRVEETVLKSSFNKGSLRFDNPSYDGDLYIDGEFQNKIFRNRTYTYTQIPIGTHWIKINSSNGIDSFQVEVLSGRRKSLSSITDLVGKKDGSIRFKKNRNDSIAYYNYLRSIVNTTNQIRIKSFPTEWGKVEVEFWITKSDSISSDQLVNPLLVRSLLEMTNEANRILAKSGNTLISKLHIGPTTNGRHGPGSNHNFGVALDISRVNNQRLTNRLEFNPSAFGDELKTEINEILELNQEGLETYLQTLALQLAFEKIPYRRENYGPIIKRKYLKEKGLSINAKTSIKGHEDHIHISVR